MKKTKITTEEFDKIFDNGKENILDYCDTESVVISKPEKKDTQRVNVDIPHWMLDALDEEAARLAVTRQSVIKIMLDEGLKRCKN